MSIFDNLKTARENQFQEHRLNRFHGFFGQFYNDGSAISGSDKTLTLFREGQDSDQQERDDAIYVTDGGLLLVKLHGIMIDAGASDNSKIRYRLNDEVVTVVQDDGGSGQTITVQSAGTESTTAANDDIAIVSKDTNGIAVKATLDADGTSTSGDVYVQAYIELLSYMDDYDFLKYGRIQRNDLTT